MMCLEIGYPDRATERQVLISHRTGEPVDQLKPVLSMDETTALQQQVRQVRIEDSLNEYLLDIVDATRKHEELSLGISTRGAVTFYRAVQGFAFVSGRDYAIPDDIRTLVGPVLAHRIVPRGLLREGQRGRQRTILQQIVNKIPVPR